MSSIFVSDLEAVFVLGGLWKVTAPAIGLGGGFPINNDGTGAVVKNVITAVLSALLIVDVNVPSKRNLHLPVCPLPII